MTRPQRPRPPEVPIFTLYGEQGAISDLEFVHIEEIAARSQRYGWEIDSHAHRGLFQMLCLFGGGATVHLDDATFDMRPPAALVIPPTVVHAFRFLPGTQGCVLTLADALLSGADAPQRALFEPLMSGPHLVDLGRKDGVAQRVAALLEQIFDEFRFPRGGRDQMFDWLVRAVLLLVARQLSAAPLSGSTPGRADLFARFRGLVEAHFAEHWPVPRYAAVLNVTESRLNRLCHALAGKSAFDVVQDRLLLEARRKLYYIAAPVSQLAYELGFADPAYFCRFFKKRTGVAPSTFRRQRGEG
ncbi:helix-turn-helix domain-containing protein [Sulfurisoma sediminicola]|uniref:AraC family transcriptional regulator n=1 Tax=Sulfurisoma sediminicola TaxID=1381557 RepID=A0A497XE45_9PROT|nr:helix-turn-helix domain-containing protein [Sulfurisoma sediminicola]RLJ65251.1 AraC family transcriptional regulator [Sulfurisoma sediminicola]